MSPRGIVARSPKASYEIQLGYVCNAECSFCSQELSWRDSGWMPLDQAQRLAYAGYQDGRRRLNLLGGEASFYPGLERLIAFARRLGYGSVGFQTNGLKLAEPGTAQTLAAVGLTDVSISVHGARAATHDALVKVPGAYEKILRAVANLKQAGVAVSCVFVLVRPNAGELDEFCRVFLSDVGVSGIDVVYPLYTGDFKRHAQDLAVRLPAAARVIERALRAARSRREAVAVHNVPPCQMPGCAQLVLHEEEAGSTTAKPDRREYRNERERPSYARARVGACHDCSLRSECWGADPGYVSYWGEGDFSPVPGAAR